MDDDDLDLIAEAKVGISERERARIREEAEERRRRRDNLATRGRDANELKRDLFHSSSEEESGGGWNRGGGGGKSRDRARDKAVARKKIGEGGRRNGEKKGARGDRDEFDEDNLDNFLADGHRVGGDAGCGEIWGTTTT